MLGQHVLERTQSADADQMKEFLPREREVFAKMIIDCDAEAGQFGFQDLRHERRTPAAGTRRLGALLERPDGSRTAGDGAAQIALADVVAGTNLRGIGQSAKTQGLPAVF